MALLTVFLIYFDVLVSSVGLVVAGTWLSLLGQWDAIRFGLLTLFCGMSLIRSPGVMAPAEKGFEIGGFWGPTLSTAYRYSIVIIWCVGATWVCTGQITRQAAIVPALMWAYGLVLWPWHWSQIMVLPKNYYNDREGLYYLFSFWFVNLACVIVGLMLFFARPTFWDIAGAFSATMAGAFILQITFLRRIQRWHAEEKMRKMVEDEVDRRLRSLGLAPPTE